jgi:hypothetical protein
MAVFSFSIIIVIRKRKYMPLIKLIVDITAANEIYKYFPKCMIIIFRWILDIWVIVTFTAVNVKKIPKKLYRRKPINQFNMF